MILPSDKSRRVLPRWHSPAISAQRPETHSLWTGSASMTSDRGRSAAQALEKRLADFEAHPSDAYAGDLAGAALVAGQGSVATKAAEWLLASPSSSALARHLAESILHPGLAEGQRQLAVPSDMAGTDRVIARSKIKALRQRLALAPNDPLAWAELARQHALTGSAGHARRAMRVAVGAAPDDRYLLRAAARLYQHGGDPERAHSLIVRAIRTPSDPWLVAAEIALADLAARRPRFVKIGRQLLDTALPPAHLTELASALGTLELDTGGTRRARRLFKKALEDPNDNALAQAEWAAPKIDLDLQAHLDAVSSSWEARALAAASAGDSQQALREAWGWFFDQAFASEPAIFGSYQASKAKNFTEGVKFAEQGVAANPDTFALRNNLAFCLGKLDRLTEARKQLEYLASQPRTLDQQATLYATSGLIALRAGKVAEGTRLYRLAISEVPNPDGKLLALINFAVEALRADRDSGEAIARRARQEASKLPQDRNVSAWLGHLAED